MKTKGKNFSCNNVLGKRKASDFYETPYSITRQFIQEDGTPKGNVLEPACGNLAITKVLEEFGIKCVSKDLQQGYDFLKEDKKYDYIITNPPYSLSFEFILKAKELCDYFCFLLPLSYLHGKKRYDEIYCDKSFPLSKVYVFTRYPMLGDPLRSDGKYRTGMMVYAWYVWDKKSKEGPVIRWLDNNSFVLGKEK